MRNVAPVIPLSLLELIGIVYSSRGSLDLRGIYEDIGKEKVLCTGRAGYETVSVSPWPLS